MKETDIHSPRKRIFRRIEDLSLFKSKNKKRMKEREYILEKEKEKENNNKNNISQINNLNDNMLNHPNSNEILNSDQDNYLNEINSNESNSNSNKNKLSKNKSEIKNKRRNSDITSSSNSYITQSDNVNFSEYENKESDNNKSKKKRKRKLKANKGKGKGKNNHIEKINKNNDSLKNKISATSKNDDIQINDNIIDENGNDDDYETILIDRKDLIEVKPYNECKENNRITNGEEEEFLNDFDIFGNELLDNNQMEFLNYDYYNIQRKLREYCSMRYHDDEIFNENKTFFNKFK